MKKHLLFTLPILIALFSATCKKEKKEIELLPEATKIGKHTFGCLINGALFTPKTPAASFSYLSASYSYIDGVYQLTIGAPRQTAEKSDMIYLFTNGLTLEAGKTYPISEHLAKNAASASYDLYSNGKATSFKSSSTLGGELTISRIDKEVIAGTFWFDGIAPNGEKVALREGRFDIKF